jgi:60 kDa SS-A/Ro ribonucleoprotein
MARTNTKVDYRAKTREGGRADPHMKPLVELERAVATCLLWENTFYENGSEIAKRIGELSRMVSPEDVAAVAIKARTDYKLRHVPLFLCLQLIAMTSGRKDGLASKTIARVIQRPDEMGELISLYRKDKRVPLAGQLKKGLREAFGKFSAYQFEKWNRDASVKLRDVMFLVSPKPTKDREQLYKAIAENQLQSADTWEVALSAGKDKKEVWERLLSEKKLGYMALLMNLRNMEQAHVDRGLIESVLLAGAPKSKALPFRFVSAAKHAPAFAQALSDSMLSALTEAQKLKGSTLLVVDVSGSMDAPISAKSELMRLDAAGALAVLLREVCESCRVFTFSNSLVEVSNFRGLPMLAGINQSQQHGGTELAGALQRLKGYVPNATRVIVVTDEQSSDGNIPKWTERGYICNVAPYRPGLETSGGWVRVNGWSERLVDWIRLEEQTSNQ